MSQSNDLGSLKPYVNKLGWSTFLIFKRNFIGIASGGLEIFSGHKHF